MKIKADGIYITDNGAVYCGKHLGATAQLTGRDISGQTILPITPAIAQSEFKNYRFEFACENCGVKASLIHI